MKTKICHDNQFDAADVGNNEGQDKTGGDAASAADAACVAAVVMMSAMVVI